MLEIVVSGFLNQMLHLYILVNNIVFVSISVIIGIDRHTDTLLTMKVVSIMGCSSSVYEIRLGGNKCSEICTKYVLQQLQQKK
jgi:hypothetical protein